MTWGKTIDIEYTKTGKFVRPLTGPKTGQIGEIVRYHNWGGIAVQFEDDAILTYANDDVDLVDTPTLKPCPFCASNEIRYSSEGSKAGLGEDHVYWCGNCGAFGPNDISQKYARDMWNLRRTS